MTSTTVDRRVKTIPFLSFDELEDKYLVPFREAVSKIETFSVELQNIAGLVETTYWEIRFADPPTFEKLGGLAVFMDYLEMEIDHLRDQARGLRKAWPTFEALRDEGLVRSELGASDDA